MIVVCNSADNLFTKKEILTIQETRIGLIQRPQGADLDLHISKE
jgi:hypothetical protein